ncbi:hypothetical protein PROFUN_16497, partial [Planoprotostelium fungivorum]
RAWDKIDTPSLSSFRWLLGGLAHSISNKHLLSRYFILLWGHPTIMWEEPNKCLVRGAQQLKSKCLPRMTHFFGFKIVQCESQRIQEKVKSSLVGLVALDTD